MIAYGRLAAAVVLLALALPAPAQALNRSVVCRSLLEIIPGPTAIRELDLEQTHQALGFFSKFRQDDLEQYTYSRGVNEPSRASLNSKLDIVSSSDPLAARLRAAGYLQEMEQDLDDHVLYPSLASGRVLNGRDPIFKFIADLGLQSDTQSQTESRLLKRKLIGLGLVGAGGAMITAGGVLAGNLPFEIAGLMMTLVPGAMAVHSAFEYSNELADPILAMQKIARWPRQGDWVYMHGVTEQLVFDILVYAAPEPVLATMVRPKLR